MPYIDDTLKKAILEEVIYPNIDTIATLTFEALFKSLEQDPKTSDNIRTSIINGTMDIVEPLIRGSIDVFNDIIQSQIYMLTRDVEFLKSLSVSYQELVPNGNLKVMTQQRMVEFYKNYCKIYDHEHPDDYANCLKLAEKKKKLDEKKAQDQSDTANAES
jgi:hypothetical protein